MRLSAIKLSGFKSFVDITSIPLGGQIVGIVGPNGCGKSNLVDAVRWVLGESKASELRGESMADVIFNGATGRASASRASVELIFDNSLGRLGGQWGQYAEIVIKRVVTRDGVSSFSINQQVVRRRDIQDMLTGTGVGSARAYAIIGQGMVSRIVEARPDELRIFLEEAAGIAKYKNRRRETEERLADTRDNLARVNDILTELNTQSQRLSSQAKKAQRYLDLQEQQRLAWQQVGLIGARNHGAQEQQARQAINQLQTEIEAVRSTLAGIERSLVDLRQPNQVAQDNLQQMQGELFQCNTQISQLESRLRYLRETLQRVDTQLLEVESRQNELATTQIANQEETAQHQLALTQAEAGLGFQIKQLAQVESQFQQQTQARQANQQSHQTAREQVVRGESELSALRNKLTDLQRRQSTQTQQAQTAQQKLQALPQNATQIDETQLQSLQQVAKELKTGIEQDTQALTAIESQLLLATSEKNSTFETLTRLNARLTSVQELQQSLQQKATSQTWIKQRNLQQITPLWQKIRVQEGWETALEAVLRERVDALAIDDWATIEAALSDKVPGKIYFYHQSSNPGSVASLPVVASLLQRVSSEDPRVSSLLQDWLALVRCADTWSEALAQQSSLASGELIVLPTGHVFDRHGVRLYGIERAEEGQLKRQQEITTLEKNLRAQQIVHTAAQERWQELQHSHQQQRQQLAASQQQFTRNQEAQQVQTRQIQQQREAVLQLQMSHQTLQAEINSIELQKVQLVQEAELLSKTITQAELGLNQLRAQFDVQREASELQQQDYEGLRQQVQQTQLGRQQAEFAKTQQQANCQRSRAHALQLQDLIRQQTERKTQLLGEKQELTQAIASSPLQDQLAFRLQLESKVQIARSHAESQAQVMRQLDEKRLSTLLTLTPLQEQLNQLQLAAQAAQIHAAQYLNWLEGLSPEAITSMTAALAADIDLAQSEQAAKVLEKQVADLGAVNLEAPDELAQVEARRVSLQEQFDDLTSAIDTLMAAIREIDAETRTLLQVTFDAVNQHFAELFPRLFGGGNAKLVMTGSEILDAGVQVMAQPPGKKNSTIYLLSGGEKALTAVALIFALFRLNPAPFCLLDEVDAPLDDANTTRLTQLVKEMSTQTQFVFITHNKIAMEMAQQLIGVTMQEQGVSRVVSVDLEQAVAVAQIE